MAHPSQDRTPHGQKATDKPLKEHEEQVRINKHFPLHHSPPANYPVTLELDISGGKRKDNTYTFTVGGAEYKGKAKTLYYGYAEINPIKTEDYQTIPSTQYSYQDVIELTYTPVGNERFSEKLTPVRVPNPESRFVLFRVGYVPP
eukprot:TRINITY_DN11006_c0_g1_i4.p1 TRINITY_DN11006_c0_g1~~TRINITY_DN11006_c0_g1_i4.p1  ORF type:complete len:145 (-),score=22.81 TRINITY_DN11006_c0_g1_i4:18-452(-)